MPERPAEKVLFISPVFYEYTTRVKAGLEALGYAVTYVNERPSAGFDPLFSLLLKTSTALLRRYCRAVLNRRLGQLTDSFDVVFILHGELIGAAQLSRLRRANPTARFVYYNWDSVASNPNGLRLTSEVDAAYTFDPADARRYAPLLTYLPMFVLPEFFTRPAGPPDADLLFIGNDHSDRTPLLRALARRAGQLGLRFDVCLLVAPRWYWWRRWRGDALLPGYITRPLGLNEVRQRMARTRVLLDLHHPGQTGLTQRTFEALAMGLKLITTNETVRNEPFFHPDRVWVLDRTAPDLDPMWFERPAAPTDLRAYSLETWLSRVLAPKAVFV